MKTLINFFLCKRNEKNNLNEKEKDGDNISTHSIRKRDLHVERKNSLHRNSYSDYRIYFI